MEFTYTTGKNTATFETSMREQIMLTVLLSECGALCRSDVQRVHDWPEIPPNMRVLVGLFVLHQHFCQGNASACHHRPILDSFDDEVTLAGQALAELTVTHMVAHLCPVPHDVDNPAGIPGHKLRTTDSWLITPQECEGAAATVRAFLDSDPFEPGSWGQRRFPDFAALLERGITDNGIIVS